MRNGKPGSVALVMPWSTPARPWRKSTFISSGGVSDDGAPNPLTGFSIVKADDLDAALEMAKGCPFIEIGTIEVAEVC